MITADSDPVILTALNSDRSTWPGKPGITGWTVCADVSEFRTPGIIRRFAPLSSRTGHWDFLYLVRGKPQRWHEIAGERRVLILAEPGAGKTFEARTRAR